MRVGQQHVIEHRRVLGGDWIKVQLVGDDLAEWAQARVAAYNEQSGCGDWRIRPLGDGEAVAEARPDPVPPRVAFWPRLRFRLILIFSRRGRRR
jgi:hypothetical protein